MAFLFAWESEEVREGVTKGERKGYESDAADPNIISEERFLSWPVEQYVGLDERLINSPPPPSPRPTDTH